MGTVRDSERFKQRPTKNANEIIPSETRARARRQAGQPQDYFSSSAENDLSSTGNYVIDNEDMARNYSITPDIYLREGPRFGFTRFAEIWNGRLAMIGFLAAIVTELLTGKGFLAQWFGIG